MKTAMKTISVLLIFVFGYLLVQPQAMVRSAAPAQSASESAGALSWQCWEDGTVDPCHQNLVAIDMVAEDDGWAIGKNGLILHWDGASWERVGHSLENPYLQAISMVSANDGWIADRSGRFLRWDGSAWSVVNYGIFRPILDIEMVSTNDGWAVGFNGKILRWDGNAWEEQTSPSTESLNSVAMLNPSEGWIVGSNGTILRWNGTSWQSFTSPTSAYLSSVSVAATDAAIAYGNNAVLQWDGTSWKETNVGGFGYATVMFSKTNAWIGGTSGIMHWDGITWEFAIPPGGSVVMGMSAVSESSIWAVGTGGAILHWDGLEWTRISTAQSNTLHNVKMLSASDGWAVGDAGTVMHWNGNNWQKVNIAGNSQYKAVDALSPTDVWIGGSGSYDHWNGASWTAHPSNNPVNDLEMVTANNGWAASIGGIQHWNGTAWTTWPGTSGYQLTAIDMVSSTSGWAVSQSGEILRWNGTSWSAVASPTQNALEDVEMNGANDGWAVGYLTILRWNGSAWTDVSPANTPYLQGISMVAANDVWAVAENYALHWDGSQWTQSAYPERTMLSGIDMISATEGWAVGSGGVIMHYTEPIRPWTLLYYLDGDNDLGDDKGMNYNMIFNQLEAAAENANVQIVALLDGPGAHDAQVYAVKYDTNLNNFAGYTMGVDTWLLNGADEVNMSDRETLIDFAQWGKENFPASHYALVLDDHGDGLGGAMRDDTSGGKRMAVKDISYALNAITASGDDPLDVLVMNACLMGLVDDAYEFKGTANYYVASQDIQWSFLEGYKNTINKIGTYSVPINVATLYGMEYSVEMSKHPKSPTFTMSVVDLTQVENLKSAIDAYAAALTSVLPGQAGNIELLLDNVQRFPKDDAEQYHGIYVDLYDFAVLSKAFINDQTVKDQADAILQILDNGYVVKNWHDEVENRNAHGVSLFFPNQKSSFYNGGNYRFADGVIWPIPGSSAATGPLNAAGDSWGSFLVQYFALTQPDGPDDPEPPEVESKPMPPLFWIRLPTVSRQ